MRSMVNQVINKLEQTGLSDIRPNEPLSRYTTWKVGGQAELMVCPRDKKELEILMQVIKDHQVPWMVIGRGSNLLVPDRGVQGVVIKLGEGFNHLEIQGTEVIAGGAYSTVLLATMATKNHLSGLEFAGGIPGNVGGAVYMNAGAHGSDISQVLVSAEVLTDEGEWLILSNEELRFSYRTSVLQKSIRGIVTEAKFQLVEADKEEVAATFIRFKQRRQQTQPLQLPCAGSVFRNPPGDHAGRLIEEAGLKGYRIGGAQISTLHANFIVNQGGATADDILQLIQHVIATIEKKFSVTLHPEVLLLGGKEE